MTRPSEITNYYYQRLLTIVSMAGWGMPLLVLGFGFLVKYGALDNSYYVGDTVFYSIAAGIVICSLIEMSYVLARRNPTFLAYLLLTIAFHVLSVLFLLFVSGVYSPFLFCWVILAVSADIYFGFIATLFSILTLGATCLLFYFLHPGLSSEYQLDMVIALVFITTISLAMALLRETNDAERVELARTRDKAAFQRERLLTLINSMGDAVITTDQNGQITVYNAATLSLLNTNQDIKGMNIDEALRLKNAKNRHIKIFDDAQKRNRMFSRTDLVRDIKNGEDINLYINVAPVQPGYHTQAERGYIFILRDITKEKSLEEERDEFISVVSHELRTPVAITEGTISNLLILQERGAAKQKIQSAANDAHQQVVYLAKLINDLSTLSRAERGIGSDADAIDLNQILQDFYKEYQPRASAKKIGLDFQINTKIPQLFTSKLYLEEIMQNLITNAIKYTQNGGVTVMVSRQKNDDLEISFKDTGIGMSAGDQKHMFEKFYRSEDYRTRETSGTGLGLYVCKKLADKLRIKISFTSRLNHGSTFTLTIPKRLILNGEPKQPDKKLPQGFVMT